MINVDEDISSLDQIFQAVESPLSGHGKEKFAEELINLIKSKDMDHVIGVSYLTSDNLIPSRGRHIVHDIIPKQYYLEPELILSDLDRVRKNYICTSAQDGRRMEQLTEMVKTSFIGIAGDMLREGRKKLLG